MRIGFTSTSHRELSLAQVSHLIWLLSRRSKAVLIHGGCINGDDAADKIAASMGIDRVVYPASNVPTHKRVSFETLRSRTGSRVTIMPSGKALDRNHTIVEMSDTLLAMPGTPHEILRSGTWATVRYARKYWKNDPARVKVVIP